MLVPFCLDKDLFVFCERTRISIKLNLLRLEEQLESEINISQKTRGDQDNLMKLQTTMFIHRQSLVKGHDISTIQLGYKTFTATM